MPAKHRPSFVLRGLAVTVIALVTMILAPISQADAAVPWQTQGYIAHAFGSPPTGEIYTNSREAFHESYRKGFRTFEVDLVRLKDGKVMLAHDRFEPRYGLAAGVRFSQVTYAQMKGRKLDGKWPALFGGELLHLVKNHSDATFILDTKDDDLAISAWFVKYMAPSSLARIRPHVYGQSHLDGLKKLHRWSGYVIATYRWSKATIEQKTLDLVMRNRMQTIMIRPHEISPTFESRLRAAGARWFFVHSFSDPAGITQWRAVGWGVYSNGWLEPASEQASL
jgi:glycerophosphoryl diester phosphodiesterase